jgi:hypothetical protein
MCAAYVQEPIAISELKTLIDNNFDVKTSTAIPAPTVNVTDIVRFEPPMVFTGTSYCNIHMENIRENQAGHAYQHVNQYADIVLDIWTQRSTATAGGIDRQYMHDVKQEIRRIVYQNKHALTNWQILKYMEFRELYEDSTAHRFHGQIRLRVENEGVAIESEVIATDDFDRANAATLGANWSEDAGTWGIASNLADLQSATANAHAHYTGTAFTKNHKVLVDVVTAASMEAGIIFRWSDTSNYLSVRLMDVAGTKYLRLFKTVAGSETQIAEILARSTGFVNWTDGDTVEIGVDLYNDLMGVHYNGRNVIAVTETFNNTAIHYGLFSDSDTASRFDNFKVLSSGGAGA